MILTSSCVDTQIGVGVSREKSTKLNAMSSRATCMDPHSLRRVLLLMRSWRKRVLLRWPMETTRRLFYEQSMPSSIKMSLDTCWCGTLLYVVPGSGGGVSDCRNTGIPVFLVFCLHAPWQITQEISENEIEKKADVLCILFNPDEPESLTFAEDAFKKLPGSIPRVVIAFKRTGKSPAPVGGDLATEAMLKQFPTVFLCDDETKVADAIMLLVRTALRPYVTAQRVTIWRACRYWMLMYGVSRFAFV